MPPHQWALWPNYTDRNPDQTICSDGEIGTVLKTYRETLVAYDEKWFADKFHQCQKIMDRWMTVMDAQVLSCSMTMRTSDASLFAG